MKEQFAIFPKLPIVGYLQLFTVDGKSIYRIEVLKKSKPTKLSPFFLDCYKQFKTFLEEENKKIEIKLDFSKVSRFEMKVLEVMKTIPYGKVMSYKQIGEELNSKGYQAIGNACGKNPFLLIYPCHRVVGTNNPGGFAHGLKMKKELLMLEGVSLSSFSQQNTDVQKDISH
jgi:O-6-methylguanine DNA methyltransferase